MLEGTNIRTDTEILYMMFGVCVFKNNIYLKKKDRMTNDRNRNRQNGIK